MAVLTALRRGASTAARWIAAAGVLALLAASVAVVADVLMRSLLRSPLLAVADLAPLVTAGAVAACFPAAVTNRQHIVVTALGERMGGRAQRVLDLLGALAVLVFFGLAAWQLLLYAADKTASGESTLVLRFATAPAWWVVATMILLAALCAALDVLERLRAALGPG